METTSDAMGTTNIRCDTGTRDRLVKLGKYGDTMDDILKKVLDFYEKHHTPKE